MILGPISFFIKQPGKRRSRIWIGLVCGIWLSAFIASPSAGEEKHTSGSSAKSLRKQTVSSLPLDQLNPQTRDKINSVVKKPSVYRRLPVTSISADPDHFRFLVRHPEVVVNIWQLMGVTQMETERTGPYTIKSNDGAGTISSIELVYGTENLHIFFGTGTYEGPILKRKLNGSCVLVLRSENQIGTDGQATQTSQLDVFLKIDNATAGLIAKTIQPIVGTTADHNFVESLKFIQRLDQTTQKNGPGVEQMSHRLDIDQGVREKYAAVIDKVFQKAINASAPSRPANIRPTSLRTHEYPTQPAKTLEPTKYASPSYSFKTSSTAPMGQTGLERYSRSRPLDYANNANQLPARGNQAPTYSPPAPSSPSVYAAPAAYPSPAGQAMYGYQPSPASQIRQQGYSDFGPGFGHSYNATHAYRQLSDPRQRPVQASYDHYGNRPSSQDRSGR